MPDVFVIGGPNGAGKSTAARGMLPEFIGVKQFVNADEIARGLSGFAPETVAREAGRIMLQRLRSLARQRSDFAFESTLAARSFAPWLVGLRETGYAIHVIYIWIPSVELALQRVANRVQAGGHHVPEDTVRRRYHRGQRNFLTLYAPLADSWEVYDNSRTEPLLVAYRELPQEPTVLQAQTWRLITGEKP